MVIYVLHAWARAPEKMEGDFGNALFGVRATTCTH